MWSWFTYFSPIQSKTFEWKSPILAWIYIPSVFYELHILKKLSIFYLFSFHLRFDYEARNKKKEAKELAVIKAYEELKSKKEADSAKEWII